MSDIEWRYLAFDELTAAQLYAVLQLRAEVFVVEQACIFQDMDGADAQAMHVLGMSEGSLVAYARCFGAGIKFAEASIGRIVTRPGCFSHRVRKSSGLARRPGWKLFTVSMVLKKPGRFTSKTV
jgi:predicted GNAT family N-acyltransferase